MDGTLNEWIRNNILILTEHRIGAHTLLKLSKRHILLNEHSTEWSERLHAA